MLLGQQAEQYDTIMLFLNWEVHVHVASTTSISCRISLAPRDKMVMIAITAHSVATPICTTVTGNVYTMHRRSGCTLLTLPYCVICRDLL